MAEGRSKEGKSNSKQVAKTLVHSCAPCEHPASAEDTAECGESSRTHRKVR